MTTGPTPASSTVTLPRGVEMPLLGLGTWQASGEEVYRAVRTALDLGYRHVDTATMYGNEADVGRAVADSAVPREEVFLTTKLPPSRAADAREVLDDSLRALDVDAVDLWLVHAPPGGQASPETWERLLAAREDGLVRAVGVSNYSPEQVDELVTASGQAPAVNQVKWSPALHDPAVLAHHRDRGVVVEGYSPFKATDLADPVLARVAEAHDVSAPQVVLRWHLQHGVVVIPKSVTPERIRANADVFGFELTDDEVRDLDGLATDGVDRAGR
ncbi:aldo/keto reductase [Aquipuribacter sp. SD81]|uniref:aldo/keto reductase n=1 Tax=Aquipuribacter sp. SD81 TaxID=3127703 RepID=UPI003015B2E7